MAISLAACRNLVPPTPSPTVSAQNTPASTQPSPTNTPTSTPPNTSTSPSTTRIVPPDAEISLPPGFGISVYASGLSGPRMMALGPDGQLYVAERGQDRIVRLPDRDRDGIADRIIVVADKLNAPSSIAFFRDHSLYVAETTRIIRFSKPDQDGRYQTREVIINDLPSRRGHHTRTILFSPDWQSLYVSIGSSCNVCIEDDPRRAAIMRYDPDGSNGTLYAKGLRNAVGITFRPGTDELWATNNGRDWLGDDLPPETIYIVEKGDDAGWPYCHAAKIVDPEFGESDSCQGVLAPAVEMQAHTAPLGLTFYTGQQYPQGYRGDLFIALHGSWNRTVPVGYKIVKIDMDRGEPGEVSDFAAGWLRQDGSNWGRPVDVLTSADGSLFVSDDGEGNIYRIFYAGE